MDQASIKYTNIFHCKTLQNLPKFGFLGWKQTIWQPGIRCGQERTNHLQLADIGAVRRYISIQKILVQYQFPERLFPQMSETTFPRTTLGPLG
jgi:hypothetical protein